MIDRRAAVALALLVLTACSGGAVSVQDSSAGLADDAVVSYAFHDASVPPAYHRSVTLAVTKDSSHIVIDSYGDVLADRSQSTAPGAWEALSATLPSVMATKVEPAPQGCTGGTGVTLTVTSGGREVLALDPQFCGGSNAAAESAIDAWIAPARAQFPATEVLAPISQ